MGGRGEARCATLRQPSHHIVPEYKGREQEDAAGTRDFQVEKRRQRPPRDRTLTNRWPERNINLLNLVVYFRKVLDVVDDGRTISDAGFGMFQASQCSELGKGIYLN